MHAGSTSKKGPWERSWDYFHPGRFLVRMSAEYLNPVTFGLANRFVGFTRLKKCVTISTIKIPDQKTTEVHLKSLLR